MRILDFAGLILGVALVSSPVFATDRDGNPEGPRPPAGPAGAPSDLSQSAAVQTFSDRGLFLDATSGMTETFEREPWTGDCDSGAVASMGFFGFDVTSVPAALKLLRDGCFGNHNTSAGGKRYLGADTDIASVSAEVTFLFDRQLHAFGMYVVDLDTASLEIELGGQTFVVPATGDGGQAFFGVLSAGTFNTVTCRVSGTDVDSHYSLDDVTFGTQPPAPVDAPPPAFEHWGRLKAAYR